MGTLDFSTPPTRNKWPTKPGALTDDWCLKTHDGYVRMKREATCLLIRKQIAALNLSLAEVAERTDLSESMVSAIVRGMRSVCEFSSDFEVALEIEPGRLHALAQAALNEVARKHHNLIERMRAETIDIAREAFAAQRRHRNSSKRTTS